MEKLLAMLGLSDTPEDKLNVGSAVEWVNKHTVFEVSIENPNSIQESVKLFILKYAQLMTIQTGVSSESISGLSQSFETGRTLEKQIYELAVALLGFDAIKSTVVVVSGEDGWDYGR